MCTYMYICIYVYMCVCIYIYIYIYIHTYISIYTCMCVYIHICIYVCTLCNWQAVTTASVCRHIYIYIYTYILHIIIIITFIFKPRVNLKVDFANTRQPRYYVVVAVVVVAVGWLHGYQYSTFLHDVAGPANT